MSKVITDLEVAEMINAAMRDKNWRDGEYSAFLHKIGSALSDHFGGFVSSVSDPLDGSIDPHKSTRDEDRFCVHFLPDDRVPVDGGIYAKYDTDVTVVEWLEQ